MRTRNPEADIIRLMQHHGKKHNPEPVQLAIVTSTSPITIQVGELQVDNESLLIADYLLQNYTRQISINNGSTSTLTTKDIFSQGDTLAVVKVNTETFVILAKVVSI